jgi:cell wall-associated NlpC family hydrolase
MAASLCIASAGAWAAVPETPAGGRSGAAVADYAVTLVGTPYRAGGTTPQRGFDCSGFVYHVFAAAGRINLPRRAGDMATQGRNVDPRQLAPGDLVFYNTLGTRFSHVGIYVGNGRFVHAPSSGGSVRLVDMNNRYWAPRYSGARRLLAPSGAGRSRGPGSSRQLSGHQRQV